MNVNTGTLCTSCRGSSCGRRTLAHALAMDLVEQQVAEAVEDHLPLVGFDEL
jgi:hypothetical protein